MPRDLPTDLVLTGRIPFTVITFFSGSAFNLLRPNSVTPGKLFSRATAEEKKN